MTEENVEAPVIEDAAAVLAALDRAKAEAKDFREKFQALQKSVEEGNTENPWKAIAIKNQVALSLVEKGIKNPAVAKYVNTADLDLDEDGNLAGIDERITTAASEFPELFDVKRAVGGRADAGHKVEPEVKKTPTELQIEAMFSK